MEGETGQTKLAPEPLDLVRRFVNTRNRMRGYDFLGSGEEAVRWLTEEGYGSDLTVNESNLSRLHALREGLRVVSSSAYLGSHGGF